MSVRPATSRREPLHSGEIPIERKRIVLDGIFASYPRVKSASVLAAIVGFVSIAALAGASTSQLLAHDPGEDSHAHDTESDEDGVVEDWAQDALAGAAGTGAGIVAGAAATASSKDPARGAQVGAATGIAVGVAVSTTLDAVDPPREVHPEQSLSQNHENEHNVHAAQQTANLPGANNNYAPVVTCQPAPGVAGHQNPCHSTTSS